MIITLMQWKQFVETALKAFEDTPIIKTSKGELNMTNAGYAALAHFGIDPELIADSYPDAFEEMLGIMGDAVPMSRLGANCLWAWEYGTWDDESLKERHDEDNLTHEEWAMQKGAWAWFLLGRQFRDKQPEPTTTPYTNVPCPKHAHFMEQHERIQKEN